MSKNSRGTITDADATFIIDSLTREITTTSKKNRLLQGDHKSERFTFKMDRYIEGHDMLECKDNVFVHFRNKSSSGKDVGEYTYRVNDLAEDPTTANLPAADQKLLFSWLIESNSTEYPGSLSFLITFAKSDEVNGGYSYRWSTMINNTTTIAVGMDNGQNTSDTYLPNFIEELKDDVFDNAEVWFEDLMVKGGDAAVLDENGVLDFQYVKNKNDEEPSIELGLSFPEDLEDKTITIKQLAGVTGVDWGSSIVSEEISAPAATTGYQKLTVHYLAETLNPTIKIYGPTSTEMMTFEYKCKDYIISAKFGSKIHTVGQLGGLKNLTTVELGENVGHYYLYGKQSMIVASGNVAYVTLKSITPPTFDGSENPEFNPFENNNADLKVMVPAESYEAYKTAWAGRNIPLVSYALTDQLEGLAEKTYVDEQDATTLSNAKVFAQAEAQGVKTYVDEQLSNFTPTEGESSVEIKALELFNKGDYAKIVVYAPNINFISTPDLAKHVEYVDWGDNVYAIGQVDMVNGNTVGMPFAGNVVNDEDIVNFVDGNGNIVARNCKITTVNVTDGYLTLVFENDMEDVVNIGCYAQSPTGIQKVNDYASHYYSGLMLPGIPMPYYFTIMVYGLNKEFSGGNSEYLEVELGNDIETISANAFYEAYKLGRIKLSENLRTIGKMAFYDTNSLNEITLPKHVYSIGENAFGWSGTWGDCKKIIRLENPAPPMITSLSAHAENITKIIVPNESLEAYKTANGWSNYATVIDSYMMASEVDSKLEGLASKTYVDEQLSNFTPTEGGVTEEYVNNQIGSAFTELEQNVSGEIQSLAKSIDDINSSINDLATTEYVDAVESRVDSLEAYISNSPTREEFNSTIGDINSILDSINGEVV